MTSKYGYIHWRSTLTGKEGICCDFPVANPDKEVSRLNKQLSAQEPLLFAEPQMCRGEEKRDIDTFFKAALVFEYDESGHFYAGDEFGCIHWEAKE